MAVVDFLCSVMPSFSAGHFGFQWEIDEYTETFITTFELFQEMPDGSFKPLATSYDPSCRSMVLPDVEVEGYSADFYIVTTYRDGSTTASKPYHFIKYQPTELKSVVWDNPTSFYDESDHKIQPGNSPNPLIKDRRIKETK